MKLQVFMCLLFSSFALGGSIFEKMEPGTVLSRFTYDYEMLKKMLDLETNLNRLTARLEDLETHRGTGSDGTTACPDGWLAFSGSCYQFGPKSVDFQTAKEYCIGRNAYLVRVESGREDVFLRTFMDENLNEDADYWIGMTDDKIEGIWMFTDSDDGVDDSENDGTEVPYYGWGGTEPQDVGSGEDCAMFAHLLQYRWADVPCTSTRRPLCEQRSAAVERTLICN